MKKLLILLLIVGCEDAVETNKLIQKKQFTEQVPEKSINIPSYETLSLLNTNLQNEDWLSNSQIKWIRDKNEILLEISLKIRQSIHNYTMYADFIENLHRIYSSDYNLRVKFNWRGNLVKEYFLTSSSEYIELEITQNNQIDSCVEFVSLMSVADVARELGWTESKVIRDYKVNLWRKPSSQGKGRTVGIMRAGSNARLIERSGSDYYVQSPLDKSKGWVSDFQVDKVVKLNPKTFKRCK